jgi:hypothetical protein
MSRVKRDKEAQGYLIERTCVWKYDKRIKGKLNLLKPEFI